MELFDGTVAENIARFGDQDPDEIVLAAQRAGVHEVVLRLPQGYETPIGEGGRTLSAGQRQRLGLARALYGDPVLVVLDEPNSNLDSEGDKALLSAIAGLKERGRTVVVIAHRPVTLVTMDKLLALRGGMVEMLDRRDKVMTKFRSLRPVRAADPRQGHGAFAENE